MCSSDLVNYPALVGDAWLAGVMSIPGTKVIVKARPMDRAKAIRGIDRSLIELRGQWSSTGIDSKRLEIEQHLNTLQELLTTLQADNESLLEVNVYITAYDIVGTRNNPRIKQPKASLLPTIAEMKIEGVDVIADARKLFEHINVGLPQDKRLILR